MRLEQLQHLVLVGKLKSISLAAEQAYMSQPAFSVSLSKLESELGVTLFKRSVYGVTPTEIGEAIISKAQEVLDKLDEIKQIANSGSFSAKLIINLATIPCMTDYIIPNVLSEFNSLYTFANIQVITDESINILYKVESSEVDLGIVILTDEINKKDIIFEELISDEFAVYTGKSSPLALKRAVTMKEALAQPYVAYNDEFIKNKGGISSLMAKYGKPKQVIFRSNNAEFTKKIVSLGESFTFFPKFMAVEDEYCKSGRAVSIPIKDASLKITIGLIRLKNYTLTDTEHMFVEMLKSKCLETIKKK